MNERTRCISCRRDALVKRMVFIEPTSGDDSTEVYLRGDICDDCMVIYWAWPVEAFKSPFADKR